MLLGTFELRIEFDYLHTHTCRVLLRLMPWTELFPARSLHRVHMYGSDNADVQIDQRWLLMPMPGFSR